MRHSLPRRGFVVAGLAAVVTATVAVPGAGPAKANVGELPSLPGITVVRPVSTGGFAVLFGRVRGVMARGADNSVVLRSAGR